MTNEMPEFSDARVLVAGDVMLDRFYSGDASRVSPEAPVPVVQVKQTEVRAGGAGNVALNLAALGCQVALHGVCGEDADGQVLETLLKDAGVEVRFERSSAQPTIVKLRVLSRHQQLLRMDFEQPFSPHCAERLAATLAHEFPAVSSLIISDYDKGSLVHCSRLIEAAKRSGATVLVDPKGTDWTRYRGATALTPNQTEFEAVCGACSDVDALEQRGRALMDELDLGGLVITRGEEGMLVLPRTGRAQNLATRARDVYDVTGAGDTVIATLGACLALGMELTGAANLANTAAGVVVGKLGTATVSPAELRRALQWQPAGGGVLSETELLAQVADARNQGETIVMTNGCFDLLHAGHVAYLRKLAELGDRLIIAVNDDASVRRLKGEQRPVTALEDRMAVLAALNGVDWVVPFSEDTPARLIEAVLPNVLAKGGDYRAEDIAGYQAVTGAGGEVRVIDFLPGRSTSSLIERIRGTSESSD